MSAPVEELSASLVREFLSRKGLKMTLEKMDEELPRNSESISNRASLARALHIERLMKKNKEHGNAYRTMIEVMVKFLIEREPTSNTTKSAEAKELKRFGELQSSTRTDKSLDPGEVEESQKSLKKRKGTSDGVLELKGTSDGVLELTMRGSKRYGNPLTHAVDTQLLAKDTRQSGTFILEDSDFRTLAGGPNGPVKNTGVPIHSSTSNKGGSSTSFSGRKSTSMTRKDMAPLKSQVTTTPLGSSRSAKVQKFKPRSLADFEPDERGLESVPLPSSRREPGEILPQEMGKSSLSGKVETSSGGERGGGGRGESKGGRSGGREGGGRKERGGGKWNVGRDDAVLKGGEKGITSWHSAGRAGTERKTTVPAQGYGDLLCEDLEDLEDLDLSIGPTSAPGPSRVTPVLSSGRPITLEVAKALRELIFGSAKGPSFNAEWKKQNFLFCDLPHLEYGLVQHKGGPCGVLACVQAHVLKYLLFSDSAKNHTSSPCPSPEERSTALSSAFSDILWRAGGRRQAAVALPSSSSATGLLGYAGSASYKPDNITERLVLHHFTDYSSLNGFLKQELGVFQNEGASGCVLFLLSAVLSRGIESIQCDMDERSNQLIGAHGYCTQEMVNLLLTGVAVSNVFDGNVELDSGGTTTHTLKGIPFQSEVGFLSLFEHYGSCTVGSHYKEPVFPIWVVCSESHFTVLFNHQRKLPHNWHLERSFDLFYYDGLAHQDEVIRLTIDNNGGGKVAEVQNDLTPPLELCIRTKWKTAIVNWNGAEPIL